MLNERPIQNQISGCPRTGQLHAIIKAQGIITGRGDIDRCNAASAAAQQKWPEMGSFILVKQTDAKAQDSTLSYDKLDRMAWFYIAFELNANRTKETVLELIPAA